MRPAVEVRAWAEVDEPERLEVHDPRRPEGVPLSRREPEEELRRRPGSARRPGTPAAVAISFGRPGPPSSWPANPLRMLVIASTPFIRSKISVAAFWMCSWWSLRKRNATSLSSRQHRPRGSLGKRLASSRAALARARGRTAGAFCAACGTCVWKYGSPQATVMAEPLRVCPGTRRRASGGPRSSAARGFGKRARRVGDLRRDHLVVPRRDHDLDAFAVLDPHPVEEVLLGLAALPEVARSVGEPVDELVDARGAEGRTRRSADEQFLPCELHVRYGETRTRPRITRSRLRRTCWKVSGFATCSLTAYRLPWSCHA